MGDEFKDADVTKPIMIVTGGKVVLPDGTRYWWPDEDADEVEAQPLGEGWTEVGYIDADEVEGFKRGAGEETIKASEVTGHTINLEATGVSPQALSILFGFDGSKSDVATHSVVVDHVDKVSGAPPYPTFADGSNLPWWRIGERRAIRKLNETRLRDWEKAYAAWVRDGRPDREVYVRTYIPRARIEVVE